MRKEANIDAQRNAAKAPGGGWFNKAKAILTVHQDKNHMKLHDLCEKFSDEPSMRDAIRKSRPEKKRRRNW